MAPFFLTSLSLSVSHTPHTLLFSLGEGETPSHERGTSLDLFFSSFSSPLLNQCIQARPRGALSLYPCGQRCTHILSSCLSSLGVCGWGSLFPFGPSPLASHHSPLLLSQGGLALRPHPTNHIAPLRRLFFICPTFHSCPLSLSLYSPPLFLPDKVLLLAANHPIGTWTIRGPWSHSLAPRVPFLTPRPLCLVCVCAESKKGKKSKSCLLLSLISWVPLSRSACSGRRAAASARPALRCLSSSRLLLCLALSLPLSSLSCVCRVD